MVPVGQDDRELPQVRKSNLTPCWWVGFTRTIADRAAAGVHDDGWGGGCGGHGLVLLLSRRLLAPGGTSRESAYRKLISSQYFSFGSTVKFEAMLSLTAPGDDVPEGDNSDVLPEAQCGSPVYWVLHVHDCLHLVLAGGQDVLEPEHGDMKLGEELVGGDWRCPSQ